MAPPDMKNPQSNFRGRPAIIPNIHLEFQAELALIASILLCHFFLLLASEAPYWRSSIAATKESYVDAPIMMSMVLALMYTFSIPKLVSKVVIFTNADIIDLLLILGGSPDFIVKEVLRSFLKLMTDVAIKTVITEAAIYAVLVMSISSFSHFIAVDFPRVIVFTIISLVFFPGLSLIMLRHDCLKYVRSLNRNISIHSNRPNSVGLIITAFVVRAAKRFRGFFRRDENGR
jgi:hypothetical protein